MACRMIFGQRAPSAVLDANHRSFALRSERDLDERLLVRFEIRATPFEGETLRRIPLDDRSDLKRAFAGRQRDRLEDAPAELGLEDDLPRALARIAEAASLAPPL